MLWLSRYLPLLKERRWEKKRRNRSRVKRILLNKSVGDFHVQQNGTAIPRVPFKFAFVVSLLLEVLLVLFSGGCAARSKMMVPAGFEVAKKIPGAVRVDEVVGSRETGSFQLLMSQISSVAFTEAIIDSIAEAELFGAVVETNDADYILDVTILYYDQPLIGLDLDIKMKTKWDLTDAKKLTPVWSDTFETTYRAKLSDALLPAERSRKAYEGAVRTNIAEAIKRLSQADL